MTKDDERDLARGRLIRLRQEANEDLQDAECRAKQHVRVLRKWVSFFDDDGTNRPMSCPSHEELMAVDAEIRKAKACLANLALGIVDANE